MGWIPAVAAAAKKRREEKEEAEMIQQLQREDPEGLNEYKVLRSYRFAFGREARLREVLDEEAQAGWEMVAKLDNGRLMLRRRRSEREADAVRPPGIDAYRTTVDTNLPLLAGLVALVVLVLALLGVMSGLTSAVLAVLVAAGVVVLLLAVVMSSRQ
jgi:hypothetical protein